MLLAATLATGCAGAPGAGPPRDPWSPRALAGSWKGLGTNRLRFDGARWSLRSHDMRYVGTYRIEGERLVLHTERVLPASYGELCRGETDEYRWAVVDEALTLRPTGDVCSRSLGTVLLGRWTKR